MKTGTDHFVSIEAAVRYYAPLEGGSKLAKNVVAEKLGEGLIHLGPPKVKVGEKLLIDREEGRYYIES
jgi:hypothetical protein